MALKDVKDEILSEAREEAEEIKREAEAEAEQIKQEAETEAEQIKQEARDEIEQQKQSIRTQKLSKARMDAKNQRLEAKQEAIDEVFDRFRNRLRQMSDSERQKFVESCLDQVEFEVGRLEASERFQSAAEETSHEVRPLEETGLAVVSEGGERRRNFTLDRIVEDYRESERQNVAEVLFK
jgi:V/A-type H+-transporting ATPase subunit E